MSGTEPRRRWLFRYGIWGRRLLLGAAPAIPLVGKASGIPDNSSTAKACLLVTIGLGVTCALVYVVEYLLAVGHRGYWLDHRLR